MGGRKLEKNKICVYAICKNESHHVDAWVKSMKEADSVVVLDTGSTDDTVEKLKAYGIKVEQIQYDFFRFDTARNDALALVPDDCNILISTDLDEYLSEGWADVLRKEWNPEVHKRASYYFYWGQNKTSPIIYDKIHTKDFFWKYPVHEFLVRKDAEFYQHEECLDLCGKITLYHNPDNHSRQFYLPLLELRYEENKGNDLYGAMYLAREYTFNRMWEQCKQTALEALATYKYPRWEEAALHEYIGDSLYNLGDTNAALCEYLKEKKLAPEFRNGYSKAGMALLDTDINMPNFAKAILEDGLKCEYTYSWLDDYSLHEWKYYDWLAVACYYSGDYIQGLQYAYKALENDRKNEHVIDNIYHLLKKMSEEGVK